VSIRLGGGILRRGSFVRNFLVVFSGSSGALLMGLLLLPVVSRFFTSEDFGVYGSFNSVLGILAAFATLQYSQAIMLPRSTVDALHLLIVSCAAVVIIGFLCGITVVVFSSAARSLLHAPRGWLPGLLPLAAVAGGLNTSFQAWCVRAKAFRRTSASQIVGALALNGAWFAAGVAHAGGAGLVSGTVFSGIAAASNLSAIIRRDLRRMRKSLSWARTKELIREYRDFPIYSTPQNVMNALSQGLPVLLLGKFYGLEIAGFYAFGMKVLSAPLASIQTALRQVLFQRSCEIQNQGGDLKRLFAKATGGLFSMVLLPSLILMAWAPRIFAIVFGSRWQEAGGFARWLILWVSIGFCNVPAVLLARVLRQQRNLFLFECLVLTSRTSALIIGGRLWPAQQTIAVFSLIGFALNAGFIIWIWTVIHRHHLREAIG
jgi:O-antigen/teichoic acid export membrane protein